MTTIDITDPAVVERTALWLAAHFGADHITEDVMPTPGAMREAWRREAIFMLRTAAGQDVGKEPI